MAPRLLRLTVALLALSAAAPVAARELDTLDRLTASCGENCSRAARVDLALQRAAAWMTRFDGDLRFDAAVLLTLIREHVDSPELRAAFAKARPRADFDADHPHRRLWTPDFVSPPEHTRGWDVPGATDKRVNPNFVVSEALHCAANGWRDETERYVCGPMRDDGGYQSTHALWALDIAIRNGCTRAEDCVATLRHEMRERQPDPFAPEKTLDIDLFSERLALYARTGPIDERVASDIDRLLALQQPDGSWGIGRDDDAYYRYHATGTAAWALAEWSAKVPSAGR